jgi:orotate phosphoribosyltransferase
MILSKIVAEKTAALLLQIKSIKLNLQSPYTWASGWNSPIYCDNRLTLSYPEIRTYLKEQLCEVVRKKFPECECIAGVATAGIAHGALVADALDLPFVYVRSAPKSHGLTNMIEGKIIEGQKVVVVEDLISTGGSSLNVVKALRDVNCEVLGMMALFTYGFDTAINNFNDADCSFFTLTDYQTLIEKAVKEKLVDAADLETLNAWRMKPAEWSKGL